MVSEHNGTVSRVLVKMELHYLFVNILVYFVNFCTELHIFVYSIKIHREDKMFGDTIRCDSTTW